MSNKFLRGSPLLVGNNTTPGDRLTKQEIEYFTIILKACEDYGCDFYPTIINKLRYDEMYEIAAYGGFPRRYPHWSFGMDYGKMTREYEYGLMRIYEMITNSRPCQMYILNSNTLMDNIMVVAHATFHNDFFKNNIYFQPTNVSNPHAENMVNTMANHGSRIRKYMNRWGMERVTEFIDHVLRIRTLVDVSKSWDNRVIKDIVMRDEKTTEHPRLVNVNKNNLYMDPFINKREYINEEKERIHKQEVEKELDLFRGEEKDIFGYIRDHAPLKHWQQDVISMLYEEEMYFAPQRLTKTTNEGFACAIFNTLLSTDKGLLKIGDIVTNKLQVKIYDGEKTQNIVNWYTFEDKETYKIVSRLGYTFEGSLSHRVLSADDEWMRLDSLKVGDKFKIGVGGKVWSNDVVKIDYKCKRLTMTKKQIAEKFNVSYESVKNNTLKNIEVQKAIDVYNEERLACSNMQNYRKSITIPAYVDEKLGYWLGLMIGDGHISETGRSLGLTTGDDEQVELYRDLTKELFDLDVRIKWDASSKNGRWRAFVTSKDLQELCKHLGMKTGVCARQKSVPECILKSSQEVVAAFIRGLFDCDGYGGNHGVILSTSSDEMVNQIQCLLLNFGIVSKKTRCAKEIWQLSIKGTAAKLYHTMIGFYLKRKNEGLKKYISSKRLNNSTEIDEIVSIEKTGLGTVYDITVEDSHKYCAQGYVNHNSYGDYVIMARQGYCSLGQASHDAGIVEYAKHKTGVLGGKYSMNPYKLGFSLLLDIEERWNKGQFGTEWDNCNDWKQKREWDLKLGLGKEKVFEVRKYYNDLTFILEYFTPDFCEKNEFFEYKTYPNGEIKIESRDFKKIKRNLLEKYANNGLPDIRMIDPNHKGKGWMLLEHKNEGRELHEPYARATLNSLYYLWGKEVVLITQNKNAEETIYVCGGLDPEKDVAKVSRSDYDRRW